MWSFWLGLLGIGVGAFGVMVGTGGGLILVPTLLIFSDMHPQVVAGTSLTLVSINSLSGFLAYRRLKVIDFRSGLLFAIAAIPGSVMAPLVVKSVPGHTFRILFGILVIGIAIQILIKERPKSQRQKHLLQDVKLKSIPRNDAGTANRSLPLRYRLKKNSRAIITKDGTLIRYDFNEILATSFNIILGFVSAFFGTGGGFLRTPLLISAFGFPVRVAVATSVFALSIYAPVGAMVHVLLDHVNWYPTFFWVGAGMLIGSQTGARLAAKLKSAWLLRILMLVLLVMGLRLLLQGLME